MNNGWIKLHRKFIEWEWYDDANVMRLFIHCLLLANHEDKKWRGIEIKRGTFISSYSKISASLKLSVQQVRTAFDKLHKTGEITRETTSEYTKVIVCNYSTYQSDKKESNKPNNNQITSEQQSNNNQITTTKNDKNYKNEKNISPLISDYKKLQKMEEPLTVEEGEALIEKYGRVNVEDVLLSMENWKGIEKKNKSTNLTAQTWLRKDAKKKKESDQPLPPYLTNKLN